MPSWMSEAAYSRALERLDWEVFRLEDRNREWLGLKSRQRTRQDKSSRAERAFSFVYVAGVLEDLYRDLSSTIPEDLQSVSVRPRDLRPAALSLLRPRVWDDLNTDRVAKLGRRQKVIELANSFYAADEPLDLSDVKNLALTDGRTVSVHNFEVLWEGLCLSPSEESLWISDQHRRAVLTVAEKRNTIAHFNTDPRVEAFRYSYLDLSERAQKVRETVERLSEHTVLWLDRYAIS